MATVDMDMAEMAKNQTRNKSGIGKAVAVIVTILAAVNLLVLFVAPELMAPQGAEESLPVISEADGLGSGQAKLTVAQPLRSFDGNGIFNPLDGVEAFDTDGREITAKVAVAYIPGKTVQQKEIRYTVYDSQNEKMEAACELLLDGYTGPSITIGEIKAISWEDLQRLTEILIEQDVLQGDDGFGNDATAGITYFYEINPDMQTVEVTFSLMNQFQDYRNEKVVLTVEDIPVGLE